LKWGESGEATGYNFETTEKAAPDFKVFFLHFGAVGGWSHQLSSNWLSLLSSGLTLLLMEPTALQKPPLKRAENARKRQTRVFLFSTFLSGWFLYVFTQPNTKLIKIII